jgi:beta-lactam-binding protein with PASTA domain
MKRKVYAILLSLAIVFLFVGCSSNNNIENVKVPSIDGLKVSEAQTVVANSKLILQVVDSQYSDTVPIDCIISQNPEPGTTVKSESIITAVISNGTSQVLVPDITGQSFDDATQTLKNVNLYISDITEVANSASPGTIISQDPQADNFLPPNSGVKVTVSIGTMITVPNLIGMTLDDAKSTISSSGLVLNKVDYIDNAANATSGTVIYQYPMPGLTVKQGAEIRLQVAK